MTRFSVMVIGGLSLVMPFGCSRTVSDLRIFGASADDRLLYEDRVGRPTRWASKAGNVVAWAERVSRHAVIYEPYPMLESFMTVVVAARTDDAGNVTGTLLLNNGQHSETFTVFAVVGDGAHANGTEIKASNRDRTAVLKIRGKQADFEKLSGQVDSLLIRERVSVWPSSDTETPFYREDGEGPFDPPWPAVAVAARSPDSEWDGTFFLMAGSALTTENAIESIVDSTRLGLPCPMADIQGRWLKLVPNSAE